MTVQKEDRFCHSCGDNFQDSDKFRVKRGCKRKSLDDSTSGTKKSKSSNEYMKEKGVEKVAFLKLDFNLVRTTVKTLRKVASLQTYDPKL